MSIDSTAIDPTAAGYDPDKIGGITPEGPARWVRWGKSAWVTRVLALIAFLCLWAFLTIPWGWNGDKPMMLPLYLPSIPSVWEAFIQSNTIHPIAPGVDKMVVGEQGYYLWQHLLATLQRIGLGLLFAIIVGIPLGLLMANFKFINTAAEPYINFLRSLPPLGYIGLLIVWFGIGNTSKIWLLFLAAFPPITIATIAGVRGIKEDQIHAAQTLGAKRHQIVTSVTIPAIAPDLITGIRVAVGFAWTTVVAAELNNGIPGIGGLAYLSGTELKTPLTIVCIIVIGITAIVLDSGIKALEKVLVPWRGKA
ncbi:MAG: ABC transporter permease [Actinomycetota bacterium]